MKKFSALIFLIMTILSSTSLFADPPRVFENELERKNKFYDDSVPIFVPIPGQNFMMLKTKVSYEMYGKIMRDNPKDYMGNKNPILYVSWFEAAIFCNKLSEKYGFDKVYDIDMENKTVEWDKTKDANGFRLPDPEEWRAAADWNAKSGELTEMGGEIREWLYSYLVDDKKRFAPGNERSSGDYTITTPDGKKPDISFRIVCEKK